jgi:hypothetical protein
MSGDHDELSSPASSARSQSATASSQLARYEGWILEVARRRDELRRDRTLYSRLFVGLPVISLIGFAWGVGVGVGAMITAALASAFGFYTVLFRLSEYRRELEMLRNDVIRLRKQRDG